MNRVLRLLGTLIFFFTALCARGQIDLDSLFAPHRTARTAEADALAREGSWAKAATKYQELLTKQPSPEEERWIQLFAMDADHRGKGNSRNWEVQQTERRSREATLKQWLEPYEKGKLVRDEFWLASETLLLNTVEFNQGISNPTWREIAFYLEEQVGNETNTKRLHRHLMGGLSMVNLTTFEGPNLPPETTQLLALHTAALDGLAASPFLDRNAKAEAALARALFLPGISSMPAPAWEQLRTMTLGTSLEAVFEGLNLLREVNQSRGQTTTPKPWVERAREIKKQLEGAPESFVKTLAQRDVTAAFNSWIKPHLILRAPTLVKAGEDFQLVYGFCNYDKVEFSLVEVSSEVALKALEAASFEDKARVILGEGNVIGHQEVLPEKQGSFEWVHGSLAPTRVAKPSFLFSVSKAVTGDVTTWTVDSVLVDAADFLTLHNLRGDADLQAFSAGDRKLFKNARIRLEHMRPVGTVSKQKRLEANVPKELRVFEGTTDENGGLSLPYQEDGIPPADNIVGTVDGHPFIGQTRFFFREVPTLDTDLFLDRAIYKPGETVYWKLLVRRLLPLHEAVAHEKVNVGIFREGVCITSMDTVLSDNGTADGKFDLPVDIRPGHIDVVVTQGEVTSRSDSFEVANFISPPATLTTSWGTEGTQLGAIATLKAEVKYYSGEPVEGAEVLFLPSASQRGWPTMENEGQRKQFETWAEQIKSHPMAGRTDKLGRLQVPFPIPPSFGPFNLRVTVTALPPGAQELRSELSMDVNESGAWLKNEASAAHGILATPGKPTSLDFGLETCGNMPLEGQVGLRVLETTWKEIWLKPDGTTAAERQDSNVDFEQVQLPFVDAAGWTLVYANYTEQERFRTVAQVEHGSLHIEIPPLPMGRFRVELIRGGAPIVKKDPMNFRRWGAIPKEGVLYCVAPGQESVSLSPTEMGLAVGDTELGQGPLHFIAVLPRARTPHPVVISGVEYFKVYHLPFATETSRIRFLDTSLPDDALSKFRVTLVNEDRMFAEEPSSTSFEVNAPKEAEACVITMPSGPSLPGSEVTVVGKLQGDAFPAQASELSVAAVEDSLGYRRETDRNLERLGAISELTNSWTVSHRPTLEAAFQPKQIFDDRFGIMNSAYDEVEGDFIELSPFSVETRSNIGYSVSATLAGTRLRTEMAPPAGKAAYSPDTRSSSLGGHHDTTSGRLRTHFASTAFWYPKVALASDGSFAVTFKTPDNLTRWRFSLFAVGQKGLRTWDGSKTFETSLPVTARLESPRFLIEGDRVAFETQTLSMGAPAQTVTRSLALSPHFYESGKPQEVPSVPLASGETLAHPFEATAKTAGVASIEFSVKGSVHGDSMALSLPIKEDRYDQTIFGNATLSPRARKAVLHFEAPKSLEARSAALSLSLNTTEAGAMMAALPYLVDYPYGCVEQTMSRWLPALAARQACEKLGISEDEFNRAVEEKTADKHTLEKVMEECVERLIEAQNPNGGFGWWPRSESADLWMTAYVVYGFSKAESLGVEVPSSTAKQTVRFLSAAVEAGDFKKNSNTLAWALFALTTLPSDDMDERALERRAFERLFENRNSLAPTGKACLLMAAHSLHKEEDEAILMRNLENGLITTEDEDGERLAHWQGTTSWEPMDDTVESTSMTLMALSEVKPEHPLRRAAAKWLLLNRKADRWNNTRHTAFAVLALSTYFKADAVTSEGLTVDIRLNGSRINKDPLSVHASLLGDQTVNLPNDLLRAGDNRVELVRTGGTGRLFAGLLGHLSAPAAAAKEGGHLLSLNRALERRNLLPSTTGRLVPSRDKGSSDVAKQGSLVDVVVHLKAEHDYPYLKLEIPRPAGCEPTSLVSGWNAFLRPTSDVGDNERGYPLYVEDHDDRSVIFLPNLPSGEWTITLPFRAVFVGDFRALPVQIEAMYATEIHAQTSSTRLKIER